MDLFELIKQTKSHSKGLFWMILIIAAGSLFTCFVTLSSIWPFFAYSLYAFPEKDQGEYKSVEIILNDKLFYFYKELPQQLAASLENSSNHYIYLKENNLTDPYYFKLQERGITPPSFLDPIFKNKNLTEDKFIRWMKDYIEFNTNLDVKSLQLNEISIKYSPKAAITDRRIIFSYKF